MEKQKIRLGVVGSRDFSNYEFLEKQINSLINARDVEISEVISGGAKGADSLGVLYAIKNNIPQKIFIPEWDKYGKSAGYKRNVIIVDNSDIIIAFWDGQSRGTNHTINIAKEKGKEVIIILYKEVK